MRYATYSEIVDAITRANPLHAASTDGTYRLIPTWVGNDRVWMAERIEETEGFEVAYEEIVYSQNDLHSLEHFTRIGVWEDPADGKVYLDRTLHVNAPGGVALDIARLYSQKAIWSWNSKSVIETTDPATAI